jgi:hypothetical protein
LDVAGLDEAFGKRPRDFARCEALGEIRVEGCGEARVAGIFPIGVPSWGHAEEEAEAERLAGDDGGGVGDEGGFDQFLALVELGGGQGS